MDMIADSFKQAKAPWLSRTQFPIYGTIKNLLSELFKNFYEYGNSPYAAVRATEHICGHDAGKAKMIREAKQQVTISMIDRQQTTSKREEEALSAADQAEIMTSIAATVKSRLGKAEEARERATENARQHESNRPSSSSSQSNQASNTALNEWNEAALELANQLDEAQREEASEKKTLETRRWKDADIKTAVENFKAVRRSIGECMRAAAPAGDKNQEEPEKIWNSLVQCLVLQHKSQGASAFSLGDPLTPAQADILRSIAEDETSNDFTPTPGESIFSFAARLQVQEKLSCWVIQSLLPQQDVAAEQARTDGALFRALKRNLPSHLAWAAQMVSSEAATSGRRGGTFQQLVAKIYETAECLNQMEDIAEKGASSDDKSKKSSFKAVSFVATKGRLEKSPNAEITREERRDKSSTETRTTFKPKRKKPIRDNGSDDEEEPVVSVVDDDEKEDPKMGALVGLIKGLQSQVTNLAKAQRTATRDRPRGDQQQHNNTQSNPQRKLMVCYSFQNSGKCNRDNCSFQHIDGGSATAASERRSFTSPHKQNTHQKEAPSPSRDECYDFRDGRCTRGSSCRFSHAQQSSQQPSPAPHQQQRRDRVGEDPPPKACLNMWKTSTCESSRCRWDHGHWLEGGGMCHGYRDRKHCFYVFSEEGCRYSHSKSNANDTPLGTRSTQRDLPTEAAPGKQE